MNKFKRFVSLALVLCMVMAFIPVGASAAEDASYAYNIVHVDAGRKYFSVDSLKTIIDNASAAGFNQVELYLSDNQGFRFALDDMSLTTEYGTYDLTAALGDGYSDGSKYPDYTGKYLTQDEMDEIIAYANSVGIDIVPCINVPGHMGAILEEFSSFCYSTSKSSIDLDDAEAVAFALALTEKYATYFASRGCKYYNVGADEYANDLSSMGFEGMGSALYTKFVQFLNDAAAIITGLGMTPRAFNDGFYYKDYSVSIEPDKAYEVCYWSSGWSGYDVAAASTIAQKGHKMINTNGDYYWVLGNSSWQCSESKASQFDETDFQNSTVSQPAGSMFCIWCDNGSADSEANVVSKTAPVIAAFGAALPEVESLVTAEDDGVVPEPTESEPPVSSPAPAATENRTITVSVGGTATDFIEGGDYSGDYSNDCAGVTAVYESVPGGTTMEKVTSITSGTAYYIQNSSGEYLTSSAGWTSDIDDAAQWTATSTDSGYRLANGSNYLRYNYNGLGTTSRSSSASSWSFSGGEFSLVSDYYSYDLGSPVQEVTAEPIDGTTVTFNGVAVGTTYVTVGNVRYTINVVAEDLSKVTGLTVEYWITNNKVTAGGTNSLTIAAADAYSAGGLELAKLIPATGTQGSNNVAYWKTTRLDSDHQQTTGSGVNQTTNGTDITHVRYYGGSWAYSTNGLTWTNVVSGDQIVAYYMQTTTVTDEVTTEVVDWGEIYGVSSWNDANYVLMDFAVKYESGERTPGAFPIDGKTLKFHCSSDDTNVANGIVVRDSATGVYYRNIGNIRAVETAEYDIYMITVTPTSDSATTYLSSGANSESTGQSDFYAGTEKVVWVDDRANLGDFSDASKQYTSISGDVTFTVGGEPTFAGVEIFNRHGMLVTYYVRAKATEDSLTVHYIDDTAGANGLEFYSYNIAVQEGTYFKTGIALADPWKGNLVNGDVVNYYGRTQYVSADLQTLSQIGAQYLYTDYKCDRVERSDDGKHVYLYYTFNPTAYIVADFSLPLTIEAGMLSEALKNADITDMKFSGSDHTAYGKLTDNGSKVTYQPVKVLQGMDYFTLLVETTSADQVVEGAQGQVAFRVYVVPAPTVHYEETFFTVPEGAWTANGTANAGSQETEMAGTKSVNYGYTAGYTAAGMSNGTEIVSSVTGNTATVTFTGTGIDLYANCDPDCGIVTVLVKAVNADGSTSVKRIYQVQTAAAAGTSTITGQQAMVSYGLPIVTASGLPYGTYQLELLHSGYGTELGDVRLDGFRVHNTLNDLNSDKYAEGEKSPKYLELRNSVLAASGLTVDEIMGQVYTSEDKLGSGLVLSENAAIDYADLLKNGPKNELFLWPGASVSFALNSGVTAQIGLKAVNGTASYTVNGTAAQIATATDMFYHDGLKGDVSIVNTGSNVLSITKLKVFGAASAAEALAPISEELVTHALVAMGVIEKPEPVNPFVDVPADSWYFDAVQWAVENGITNGADATHFLPDALCQRATVVTMLWRAAGSPAPETAVNPFVDVTEDAFFYEAVLWAVEKGITNGVDATHFAPFGTCNRAQVVTFLWRANGQPAASAAVPFVDVAEGQWYTDAVMWAVENGVTNGMSGTIFGVESLCNRAQIVTFLYRAAK